MRVPNIGLNIVDVRAVADLHVLALSNRRAIGQRYLAVSEFMSTLFVTSVASRHSAARPARAARTHRTRYRLGRA
jgi:hypothetical protein